ncbi:MAG: BadF/BadG/BcrA/BcrD ATPase family protein [Bacteroidota bacterium]|nr:BadF/BadG/BcrA/BcrD ATPase family protein [Bacteroidota bacterium]
MKSKKYIIGMDGGGTKTHAIIADANGKILKMHFAGPSNFQIMGVEKAAETIFSLIEICCESVNCEIKNVAAVACGLTGAGRIGDQKRMAEGLKKFAESKNAKLKNIIIESDARIALEGAFKGDAGIILIAGTGSIAFGKDSKGKVHRVGGWGRMLGDEGSGYFIGRLGLTAVTRHIDGRGEKTKLTSMIAKEFGLTDQTAIIDAVYKNNFDIASVAPLVLKAAEKKDSICFTIVETAVIDLAEHIRVAGLKIIPHSAKKVKTKIHVSLIGGLIANDTLISRLLKQYLAYNHPNMEIISPMASPAYGAVVMGMKK